MTGIIELDKLLSSMSPELIDGEFVFCNVSGQLVDYLHLNPIATFIESEGLTLVLSKSIAEENGIVFDGVFKQITLTVHSSLHAVGLTAAFANKLAAKGISANVIAGFYHDHIFVQSEKASDALKALQSL